jgi:predicted thioesterase
MQVSPKTGSARQRHFFVNSACCHSLDGISLLSTSHLLQEMEQSAIDVIQESLEEGETSLGMQLNIEHRSPGMEGDRVTCTATVAYREGPLVTFHLNAEASGDCLAQGIHIRRVLRKESLQSRLEHRRLAAVNSR